MLELLIFGPSSPSDNGEGLELIFEIDSIVHCPMTGWDKMASKISAANTLFKLINLVGNYMVIKKEKSARIIYSFLI